MRTFRSLNLSRYLPQHLPALRHSGPHLTFWTLMRTIKRARIFPTWVRCVLECSGANENALLNLIGLITTAHQRWSMNIDGLLTRQSWSLIFQLHAKTSH